MSQVKWAAAFLVTIVLGGELAVARAQGVTRSVAPSATSAEAVAVPVAPAPTIAKCEVIEFRAETTGKKSIDAKLARFTAELSQPPLSAYDTFVVTGTHEVTLESGQSQAIKQTSTLGLLFKGTTRQNERERLQFELTVDDPRGKRVLRTNVTQDAGAKQLVSAGKVDKADKGMLFFATTCALVAPPGGKPKAAPAPQK